MIKLTQHKGAECRNLKYWVLTLEIQDVEIQKLFLMERNCGLRHHEATGPNCFTKVFCDVRDYSTPSYIHTTLRVEIKIL